MDIDTYIAVKASGEMEKVKLQCFVSDKLPVPKFHMVQRALIAANE